MGKRRLKERCGLDPRTNFFSFKKSPKTEYGLDSRIYGKYGQNKGAFVDITIEMPAVAYNGRPSFTNSMEQMSSWEADSCSDSQDTSCILWNIKFQYGGHKLLPLVPILSNPKYLCVPVHDE